MSAHENEIRENFMKDAIAYGAEAGESRRVVAGLATQIYKRNRPMLGEMTSEAEIQKALMTIFRDALVQLMMGRESAASEGCGEEEGLELAKQRDAQSSSRRYHGAGLDDLTEYIKGHPPIDE